METIQVTTMTQTAGYQSAEASNSTSKSASNPTTVGAAPNQRRVFLNLKTLIICVVVNAMMMINASSLFANPSSNSNLEIVFNARPDFEEPTPLTLFLFETLRDALEMSDIQISKIDIIGNLKYSGYQMKAIIVKDGVKTEIPKLFRIGWAEDDIIEDTFSIKVLTKKIDDNNEKISIKTMGYQWKINYERDADYPYILMDPIIVNATSSNATPSNKCLHGGYITNAKAIPFAVFSTGYETTNGGINFCAVQGAGLHPSEWYKEFNIKNYVYFEIEFLSKEELAKAEKASE